MFSGVFCSSEKSFPACPKTTDVKNRTILSVNAVTEEDETGATNALHSPVVVFATFSSVTVKTSCKSTNNKRITKERIDKIHEMKQIMRRKDQFERK